MGHCHPLPARMSKPGCALALHIYLGGCARNVAGHFETVVLQENAPRKADLREVMRGMRAYLEARQWSGRTVGVAELQASASSYLVARGCQDGSG